MKPSSSATVIRLPAQARSRPQDAEFLPAALEIIETPASPIGRSIAGAIALFLTIAIAWALIGQVDIIATAQGRVVSKGRSKVIQPFETGVIRAIAVRDGQIVQAGDVLVELDPTSDVSDEKHLVYALTQDQLDIARLTALLTDRPETFSPPTAADPALINLTQSQLSAQFAEQQAKLESHDRQIAQKQAEGRGVEISIQKLEASLPLLSEQRDIRKSLLHNMFGTKLLYLQLEQQVVESEHELQAQKQRRQETREAIAALERQKAEITAEYRKNILTDLAKANVQASEHQEEIVKSSLKRNLRTLRSPVDGTVQQLAVHTLGGIVTPAQQLMVIVPKDSELEIEAFLANRDVGFVHQGQDAAIKIETFNFTRYGLLHGSVQALSRDVVSAQDVQSNDPYAKKDAGEIDRNGDGRSSQQPSYAAHISVHEEGLQTEQGFSRLEPGMAVTVEIKTGRQTIISFLLSPIEKLRQESFGER